MNRDKDIIVRCECHSLDHIAEFHLFDSDNETPALYLTLHMSTWRGFFRRVVLAFQYIFGYSRHGHWDEIDISEKTAREIKEVCEAMILASDIRREKIKQGELV